jgi:thiamine-phosphate pyrophosphorylase
LTRPGPEAWHGLHVLADDDPRWPIGPVEQARAACAGGAAVVQLRAKHANDRRALEWAAAIRDLTRAAGLCFVVNDRFDLALAVEADGVHLGQGDVPPDRIPRPLRARLAVGRSTHTLDEARATCAEDVDYVAFGPVFGTTSKETGHTERGTALLADVARIVAPRPLVAIGGVCAENIARACAAGACGAAVISAVAAAGDPVAAVRRLVDAAGAG